MHNKKKGKTMKKFKLVEGSFRSEGATFYKQRDPFYNAVIYDELNDIEKVFHQEIEVDDMYNIHTLMIKNFKMPQSLIAKNPNYRYIPLLIILPDQYPFIPPIGFYLPSYINIDEHFMNTGFHGATDPVHGYKWYCASVVANSWKPASLSYISDWRNGDSIWTIITIIKELLEESE
jgi:hypothetical protein